MEDHPSHDHGAVTTWLRNSSVPQRNRHSLPSSASEQPAPAVAPRAWSGWKRNAKRAPVKFVVVCWMDPNHESSCFSKDGNCSTVATYEHIRKDTQIMYGLMEILKMAKVPARVPKMILGHQWAQGCPVAFKASLPFASLRPWAGKRSLWLHQRTLAGSRPSPKCSPGFLMQQTSWREMTLLLLLIIQFLSLVEGTSEVA